MKKEKIITTKDNIPTKKYKKLINFYKIFIEPSFRDNSKSDRTLIYELLINTFSKSNIVNVANVSFEKIQLDNNHIFGSICKTSELDILTEIRNNKTLRTIDEADLVIESYTYFYIDFSNLAVSIIKTQRIPSSQDFIRELLEKNSMLHISVQPFKKNKEDIKKSSVNSASFTFFDNEKDYIGLKKVGFFDCEIGEYTVTVKIKEHKPNFIEDIFNKVNEKYVKKMSISTDDEDIDLIKNFFTKHVSVELTKNYKQDLGKIENTLKEELLKVVKA